MKSDSLTRCALWAVQGSDVTQVRVPSCDRPASPEAGDLGRRDAAAPGGRWPVPPVQPLTPGTSRTDRTTWHNYRYAVDTVQTRAWNDKMYFMPIRFDELNRNGLLKQNPGY